MTPRQLGVMSSAADKPTRKKRIIQSKHGSFNLLGLMDQSKEAAVILQQEAAKTQEKASAKKSAEEKAAQDLLDFHLCKRQCACEGEDCKWAYFTICRVVECGRLVEPLSVCMAPNCLKLRREAKKQELVDKAKKDSWDMAKWKTCKQVDFDDEQCFCEGACLWKHHRLCENPPCSVLLAPGTNCRKKVCCQYRKANGIKPTRTRAGSKKPPISARKAAKKSTKNQATSAKRIFEFSDSSDSERNFSDRSYLSLDLDTPDMKLDPDSDESETLFEIEAIVSGPCPVKGPNFGKWFVKWLGYDSDDNTWEPRANLPEAELQLYEMKMTKERAAIVKQHRQSPRFSC
jgi:hypothetical protein